MSLVSLEDYVNMIKLQEDKAQRLTRYIEVAAFCRQWDEVLRLMRLRMLARALGHGGNVTQAVASPSFEEINR